MDKEPILLQFGQRVQEIRKARNLSQEKLAELAGVHRTYIGMIERAEKNDQLAMHRIFIECRTETAEVMMLADSPDLDVLPIQEEAERIVETDVADAIRHRIILSVNPEHIIIDIRVVEAAANMCSLVASKRNMRRRAPAQLCPTTMTSDVHGKEWQ